MLETAKVIKKFNPNHIPAGRSLESDRHNRKIVVI